MQVDAVAVLVDVRVERAAMPAHEQQHGEEDDHEPDRHLRALLDALGQVGLEEHDRQAEGEQRERVAEAPRGAEGRGPSDGALAGGRDQRAHGREVVRVGRVAQAECDRDERDHGEGCAVGVGSEPIVESEHG